MSTNANSSDEMKPASGALKGSRFKHPFTVEGEWQYYAEDEDDPTDKDTPRTLVELRMCALSAAIRSKSQWWMKFRDEEVREKWTKEIKEQQKDIHRSLQLTDNMVRAFVSRSPGRMKSSCTLTTDQLYHGRTRSVRCSS